MKKPWQSKTIIVNLLSALGAAFYPPLTQYIQSHPVEVATAFSILNVVLRLITHEEIYFSDDGLL